MRNEGEVEIAKRMYSLSIVILTIGDGLLESFLDIGELCKSNKNKTHYCKIHNNKVSEDVNCFPSIFSSTSSSASSDANVNIIIMDNFGWKCHKLVWLSKR